MKTKKAPQIISNKAALGELTLGEVWELIHERVSSVRIEDEKTEGSYTTFHSVPGVSLGFSNESPDEDYYNPDYSFPLDSKVKVREDHLELVHTDQYGDEEKLFLYFLFQPEPEVISMGFLLPGGGE